MAQSAAVWGAAGNCQEGTDWVLSWFPGRHPVSAREMAAEAIARGTQALAAFSVHRGRPRRPSHPLRSSNRCRRATVTYV